jgi:hypothetical protein
MTEVVPYSDVHILRERYMVDADRLLIVNLPQPTWGVDEIHAYLGVNSDHRLSNFDVFVEHNHLNVLHGAWRYNCIVAVGFNRDLGIYMSLVDSMFPWPYTFRDHLSFPGILRAPLIRNYMPMHTLASTCASCAEGHVSCKRGEGVSCLNCESRCRIGDGEGEARTLRCYKAVTAASATLCPPFQHLIQCAKAASGFNGNPKMSVAMRRQLKSLVEEVYAGAVYDVGKLIKERADSYQEVQCKMGVLTEIESRNMTGEYGFRVDGRPFMRIAPHFGMSAYYGAYSMMNCALCHPDRVFCFEGSLMFGSGFRVGRLYINASIATESDVRFVVGWKFKK